ncbi:hypothetical protein [Streptomyces sp. NPDC085665]|uniref:hypothetical protein n=1 Tax=Streptomyces sp. NPDC085665 TaxID=3365735 RepID=UPI0037CDF146
MPSPLPTLTPEQRAEALAKAARVRKARGAMLGDLKAGRISLLDVLNRDDDTAPPDPRPPLPAVAARHR